MAHQTMTEKDMYAAAFDREFQTSLKILKAYPAEKADLKPQGTARPAREIGWMLALTQLVVDPVLKGELSPDMALPPAPATWKDVVATAEAAHREIRPKIDRLTDTDMNGMVRMPTGPKQMGNVRRGDALWMFLNDSIHHRGQLSVYLRMAGAKVPSIYGPSGDEPWS
jgi:uncharacterized damage-inducible protein DinB